ncbi:MAG: hypothetical protein CMM47_11230 [Rhodospirillaceae bacterium]|nr:hypothetical protein [Rhodospirillaceae bacterium]
MVMTRSRRPRYTPFIGGKHRLGMGLMALELSDWIEVDENFEDELAQKNVLLAKRRAEVVATRPGSESAQQEVLDLLVEHLSEYHSHLLQQKGDDLILPTIGQTHNMAAWRAAPIDLAGRLAQEDFCLMAPGEDGYTLEAASLCFPSRWRLADKIGCPMGVIHDPVPGYGETLGRPVDRFFNYLDASRPVWRVNWSLNDDPSLFQPVRRLESEADEAITTANVGQRIFLRCERQTLRRLPTTGWVLFTIKTHVDPLSTLADYPEFATALAGSVRSLPEGSRRYKNIVPFEKTLLAYLDSLADQA